MMVIGSFVENSNQEGSGSACDGSPVNQLQVVGDVESSPSHRQCASLAELAQSPEFLDDLCKLAKCLDEEKINGLQIGEIAAKWIHGHKYNRFLNPARFAQLLKDERGYEVSGKQIDNYVKAFQENQFHGKCGKRFPHLGVSHLAQLAASRCSSDEERLELARRANDQKARMENSVWDVDDVIYAAGLAGCDLSEEAEKWLESDDAYLVSYDVSIRGMEILGEHWEGLAQKEMDAKAKREVQAS